MSRHSDIPPFARQYGANHPPVRPKILAKVERDVIGWADERGRIHFFEDVECEREERGVDWCAVAFWFGMVTIVLALGIGGGLWLAM